MKLSDLITKKIAILGFGIEGQDAASFLARHEVSSVTIFDRATPNQLKINPADWSQTNFIFNLGQPELPDLTGFDLIIKSPALNPCLPAIKSAAAAGVPVSSVAKLFFTFCPAPIIGVTGTNGKGTTVTLINNILSIAGLRSHLGGNIGLPMLSLLDNLNPSDWVVLELSSFQLQDLTASPHIAVVLNITSDHLDYHASTAEYIAAKTNIISHQSPSDLAIINADFATPLSFASHAKGQTFFFSRRRVIEKGIYWSGSYLIYTHNGKEEIIINKKDVLLRGDHNLENVAAAVLASKLAGADNGSIKKAVSAFPGLPHRLEFILSKNNVKFYEDSISTSPDTAIAALNSFTEPLILIAGGSSKGADYLPLGQTISDRNPKSLILLGATAKAIKSAAEISGYRGDINLVESLSEAVNLAWTKSKPGDIVLFSPASASFDMFKNYKDRGEQFQALVRNI